MKRIKDGYSNNPNYVGDWYGKGQIDYSAIINPNAEGDVYMVKIWCGSGYALDVYLVKARDEQDAINRVFKWSYENEGANEVVYDRDYLENLIEQDYNNEYFYGRDGGKPSDKYDLEEFEEIWLEDYVFDDNYWLFAYAENFFVGLVPDEYLNEPVSDSRRVKDEYLAPEVDEEFINGAPYGNESPKYNTFDYNEKVAIHKCKEKGGQWCVYIENIDNKQPYYSTCRATGMQVDETFSDYGIPARVLEIVTNRNGKVYVVGVSDDLTTMPERKVSDSRRVKDEYIKPFWYSFGGAFNDPYNIDREVEDEDYDTACYLMNETDEIKDKYLPNDKAYDSDVEGWVNAFHEIIELLERTPMENPESVYEYLESDNYHDVVGLMWLTGKCGKKRQQQEINFIKKRNDGGYRPCWYEAEDIIAEELGLI